MKLKFTLRKGKITDKIGTTHYLAEDIYTKGEIIVSLSAKEYLHGLKLELGEIIYIVTSPYDLKRGRFYSENQTKHLNIDFGVLKRKLDSGIDPLNLLDEKLKKEVLKKVIITEKIDASTYFGEDVLNKEKLTIRVRGKLRIHYFDIPIGEDVYMILPSINSKEGRLVIEKYICLGNVISDLCRQKRQIEADEKRVK